MAIRSIEHAGDLRGKRVLLRLDLNVPIENGVVADDYRIVKSLPTMSYLREKGAAVLVVAHIEANEATSLAPVANYARKFFDLTFLPDFTSAESLQVAKDLGPGEVAVFENLRLNKGEKANDPEFAARLASLADIYVNEAFSASHRKHASIVGVPKLIPGYAGFQFMEEIANLGKVLSPQKPFTFVLGGAKFDTKFPLVKKFAAMADHVVIGGALANDVYKMKGYEVGTSVLSDEPLSPDSIPSEPQLYVPEDVIVENAAGQEVKAADKAAPGDKIVDAGPKAGAAIAAMLASSKTVLWNGPLGYYEGGYKDATLGLAKAVAASGATSIVGGGDTLAAVKELGLLDKFTFVSTGGGAALDFLANDTLPGIEALETSARPWWKRIFMK
jgi:phosphoglycerate kinase